MKIGSEEWRTVIREGGSHLGLNISDEAARMFGRYGEELLLWNRKINLTAITDPFEIAVKHFIDSAAALPYLSDLSDLYDLYGESALSVESAGTNYRLLDIGSGPGFPGIVLKILEPGLRVTLIDSVRKKVSFMNHIIRLLGLTHIKAVHIRAQDLARRPDAAGGFDGVISRALADLDHFVALAWPFAGEGGRIIAMRGETTRADIGAARTAARTVAGISAAESDARPGLFERFEYRLPYLDAARTVVIHSASNSDME